jgi:glycosyltransferase involved in cell wall biosynthesis
MAGASGSTTWVIIPAFNEAAVVAEVIGRVREAYPNLVVVDDGSTDCTDAVAHAAGATVLRHEVNLGQGAALETGIRYALGRGAQRVVTFDADGQHRVEDIAVLERRQRESGADVIIGCRFLGACPGLPFCRRWVLRLAVLFTWLTAGVKLSDAHNGLRLFTRRAAERIRIRQCGMAHASELVGQAHDHGLTIAEAPVTILYTAYSLGKGQRLGNAFRIVADLLLARLAR